MTTLFFEDLPPGRVLTAGPYTVERGEMLAFAGKWDPLPIHVDPDAAARTLHGGIIASGTYTIAVKQRLLTALGFNDAILGTMGHDAMRFPNPVRAGDRLSLTVACVFARPSASRPTCGIVKYQVSLANQSGTVVLDYLDTVLVAKRPAPA
ncbi:MAG: acyl dehydratase [Alphaproteobacteria bacterium]|nr:acyl dehydratase [Alphaproteobacteria bacterium]